MLKLCRKAVMVQLCLIVWVLVGIMLPLSADAANRSTKAKQKIAYQKPSNKKPKAVQKRKTRKKQAQGPFTPAPNYADLVIDARTGRILHSTSSDELRHPASLTKMMTLYLTFQALKSGRLDLDQMLPISQNAANQEPSKLGLQPGRQIRVEDALLGLVTKSANDATVVLAEALGGSEEAFARQMTSKARELGMTRTVFRNPSGLPDPEQVTTARDMAILGYAMVFHYPQFYPYFSRDEFTYAGVRHSNHNHLMSRYRGMDGIKTGYIRASGFNLVASTVRGSTRLIAVVFGGRSAAARDNRMAQLLDQSFAKIQSNSSQAMLDADEELDAGKQANLSLPDRTPRGLPDQKAEVARLDNRN